MQEVKKWCFSWGVFLAIPARISAAMFAAFPLITVRRSNQNLIYSGGVLVLNFVVKGLCYPSQVDQERGRLLASCRILMLAILLTAYSDHRVLLSVMSISTILDCLFKPQTVFMGLVTVNWKVIHKEKTPRSRKLIWLASQHQVNWTGSLQIWLVIYSINFYLL